MTWKTGIILFIGWTIGLSMLAGWAYVWWSILLFSSDFTIRVDMNAYGEFFPEGYLINLGLLFWLSVPAIWAWRVSRRPPPSRT